MSMRWTGNSLARWSPAVATALAMTIATSGSASALAQQEGEVRDAGSPTAVHDSYIVMLKGNANPGIDAMVADLTARYGGAARFTYRRTLNGYASTMTAQQARRLAADPRVDHVEQDQTVQANDMQAGPPSWGLDRIDQPNLPLDNAYHYATTASNVNAYVIDTGIRITHQAFGGRAHVGYDAVIPGGDADDCSGHGTHVAGTIGGSQYGVAKGIQLFAVRVLNCQGSGTISQVVAGIDWVTTHAVKPAVANLSLGGGANATLDAAVQRSIAAGITYGIAAGNAGHDACLDSPARVPEAITASATDSTDTKPDFANVGSCVDIFAPGVGITSSFNSSDTATAMLSGTSMAAPHTVGAAALYLATHPTATPQQVQSALISAATPSVVRNAGAGTVNRLLDTTANGPTPPPSVCQPLTNGTDVWIPDAGPSVTSSITVTDCARKASATSTVQVHVKHPYRGDLVIDLITPSGGVKNLKAANISDGAANVDAVYTVNASAENANGTWALRVRDVYSGDVGYLDNWTLIE